MAPTALGAAAPVLRLLADGAMHSGESLGAMLGLSRAAVSKQVASLRRFGLEVESTAGRGYRLRQPLELLDPAVIRAHLAPAARAALSALDVHLSLGSTNDWLAARPAPAPGRFTVCLAEYQSTGRGRRGRRWTSPFATGISLSVGLQFESAPPTLAALGLAVGVCAVRALDGLGADVRLKWPNDLMIGPAKVGGILVELAGDSRGPLKAIVGLGLNVDAVPNAADMGDGSESAPVAAHLTGALPSGSRLSRNLLSARLVSRLHSGLGEFADAGFAPFAADWRRHDYLEGRSIVVRQGDQSIEGVAVGIMDDGSLQVTGPHGIRSAIVTGDVTLRGDA
jgi:BirA family biotin operon repressor/biotin-[acetyl-CoA-carboxylase] ligase